MFFREKKRMRKNAKAHSLAEEVLRKCESEEFSMADLKDFVCILQSMVDKTLLLNEESHKFIPLHSDVEVFQNSSSDIRQQSPENHHSRQG